MKNIVLLLLIAIGAVALSGCRNNIRLEENRESNQGVKIH